MARSRSRKIDNLRWVGFDNGATALAAGSVGGTMLTSSALADTIMRTRGNLIAWLDGTESPGTAVDVAVGMALVPEGTAATVLWSPISDANAPWFWYTRFHLGYEEMVTDVIDVPGISSYREVIDSKAMRRVRGDVEVQVVVENVTLLAAGSINLRVGGRILLGN